MSSEVDQLLEYHRASGGISNTTAAGSVTYTPQDYVYGLTSDMTNAFETAIILQIIDAFGSIFEWKDLPKGIDSEDLESMLLVSGRLSFVKVGNTEYLVRYSISKFDQNSNVINARIIEPKLAFLNGANLENFKHVEIKNNRLGLSIIHKIWPYIQANGELHRRVLINARVQGKVVVQAPNGSTDLNLEDINDNGEKSSDMTTGLEDSLNEWLENENVFKIFDKELMGDFSFDPIGIEDSGAALLEAISFNDGKILSSLGMPSNNLEGKEERAVKGEISLQNVFESTIIETMLKHRIKAAEQINEKFGYNVSVDYSAKVKEQMEAALEEVETPKEEKEK